MMALKYYRHYADGGSIMKYSNQTGTSAVKLIIPVCFIVIFAVNTLSAQGRLHRGDNDKRMAESMSFEEYISLVRSRLPDFEKNSATLEKSKNAINSARGIEDTRIVTSAFALGKKEYQLNPQFQQDYTSGYIISSELNRKFAATGTVFSAGAEYQQLAMSGSSRSITRIDAATMSPVYSELNLEKSYIYPLAFVEITQPVLNNAFGVIDRSHVKDAAMKFEIEKYKKIESDEKIINRFKKMYFELITYGTAVSIMQKSLENAEELERLIKEKYTLGLVDNDDYQNIKSTVITYRTLLLQYRSSHGILSRELANYLNTETIKPLPGELDSHFIRTKKAEYIPVAFNRTATGAVMDLAIDNLRYITGIRRNSALPDLNLYGKVVLKSQDESFSDAPSSMSDVDYRVGFVFSYPLGNNEKEGRIKEAELSILELEKEKERVSKEYTSRLDAIAETAANTLAKISLIEKNIDALKSRSATERKKYQQARLSLVNLIDTENKIAAEQLNLIMTKRQMIGIYFDYLSLTLSKDGGS